MINKSLFVAVSLFALTASAEELTIGGQYLGNLNGGAGLSSDYKFRGISLTRQSPAITGNIDYTLNGFKVSFDGTNVKLDDQNNGAELKSALSYTYKITDDLSAETGAVYNAYPGLDSYTHNYAEYFENVSYDLKAAKFTVSFNYTPSFFGVGGNGYYPKAAVSAPLPYGFSLNGSVGHQWTDSNLAFGVRDYTDYEVGVSYLINGFNLKGAFVDTNLDKNECKANLCSGEGVFSVSKAF